MFSFLVFSLLIISSFCSSMGNVINSSEELLARGATKVFQEVAGLPGFNKCLEKFREQLHLELTRNPCIEPVDSAAEKAKWYVSLLSAYLRDDMAPHGFYCFTEYARRIQIPTAICSG
jgi:hypothetical protein